MSTRSFLNFGKIFLILIPMMTAGSNLNGQEIAPKEVKDALSRAVSFFRNHAGYQGAYGYRCSADLKLREGEGKTGPRAGWIEPPGTPYVGEAYLEAHRLTGEKILLDAALEVGEALRKTQLESGGWAVHIELEEGRNRYRYRIEADNPKARNHTTLDDEKSQACLNFLMHLDERLEFKNKKVRDVLDYAFEKFLAAQYPNGAWPQQFSQAPDPRDFPVKKARYPEKWERTFQKKNYRGYYTFNDGTIADMMRVMLEAHRIYGERKFLDSAIRTGDFFLLAQMPEPQPGWAQQYNPEMEPAWARKFEPPSISGGESPGVMQALISIYRVTGDSKYLVPIPRALKYYKSSLRPDGTLARFYELKTNRPLYFTKDYQLTYSDSDMPTHYAFVIKSKLVQIEKYYNEAKQTPNEKLHRERKLPAYKMSAKLIRSAKEAINSMDDRGAWLEEGELRNFDDYKGKVIDSKTFAKRLNSLAAYLSAMD